MTTRGGAIGTNVAGGLSVLSQQNMRALGTFPGLGSLSGILYKAPGSASFVGAGGLSFDAAITQVLYLHPDADDTDGSWTNEVASAVNLFASIDESWPAVDTDYIQSVHDPNPDICKIRLSNPAGGLGDPTRVRTKYYSRGESPGTLTVRLKQGATEIASWAYGNIVGIPTASVETLTAPQLAAITDPTDLFLWFEASLGYAGPGDVVSGASAWYGLRAYTSASVGANAIRLRESGGNTEQDFVTITGGGLDLTAISTFKGTNSLFVVTLYDQVGTNHLSQATAGNQPQFVLSGLGALPILSFTRVSNHFMAQNTFSLTIPQPYTLSTVFNQTFTGADARLISANSGNAMIVLCDSQGAAANTFTLYAGGVSGATTCSDTAWHGVQVVWNGASSSANVDNSTTSGLNPGTETLQINLNLGSIPSLSFEGSMTELGVWPSGLSAGNQTALNSNQHSYWGF